MKIENRKASGLVRVSRNGKRFFSAEYKRGVVERCLVPGASVSAVALAHGFNANLVRTGIAKHQARQGRARTATQLVPVTVTADGVGTATRDERVRPAASSERLSGSIEIEIGGARVKVLGRIEVEQLRVVFEALGVAR